MDRYELGQQVVILEPFGDGLTRHTISAIMAINANGEQALEQEEIAYYQYEVEGCFYASHFLETL